MMNRVNLEKIFMDINLMIRSVRRRLVCIVAAIAVLGAGHISFFAQSVSALEGSGLENDSDSIAVSIETVTDYSDHWAHEYIDYVIENGYMMCVSEDDEGKVVCGDNEPSSSDGAVYTCFEPDTPMTRAMFVESLAKVAGVSFVGENLGSSLSESEEENSDVDIDIDSEKEWGIYINKESVYEPDLEALAAEFDDIDGTESYAPAAAWAVENGIINGTGSSFSPDGVMNRQTLAVIMHRAADILGLNLEEDWSVIIDYNDLDEVSDWAVEGIAYCKMTGLMNGGSDGCFAPKREITRAESAAVIVRLLEHMNENSGYTQKV